MAMKEDNALSTAALNGRADIVQALLIEGADANARSKYGMIALVHAAEKKHLEVVQVLLKHGADVNLAIDEGYNARYTALIKAAISGHTAIIGLLLDHGADVNARTQRDCYTALIHAATSRNVQKSARYEIAALSAMANTSVRDEPQVVELLLTHCTNVDATDRFGDTALMIVASHNLSGIVRLLLDHGANVNAECNENESALIVVVAHQSTLNSLFPVLRLDTVQM